MSVRVGLGYDLHPFGGDKPLKLGGVEIAGAPGLVGHSDGDVVAHAVADALLGAAGLDDLGTLYPTTGEWEGADSLAILREVAGRVAGEGWRVGNVDVVVAAERPRLASHMADMAERLSAAVDAPVNVKAKAGEGVGVIGRGEAIAAWAIALLERA